MQAPGKKKENRRNDRQPKGTNNKQVRRIEENTRIGPRGVTKRIGRGEDVEGRGRGRKEKPRIDHLARITCSQQNRKKKKKKKEKKTRKKKNKNQKQHQQPKKKKKKTKQQGPPKPDTGRNNNQARTVGIRKRRDFRLWGSHRSDDPTASNIQRHTYIKIGTKTRWKSLNPPRARCGAKKKKLGPEGATGNGGVHAEA